jgi:hypothetical protein
MITASVKRSKTLITRALLRFSLTFEINEPMQPAHSLTIPVNASANKTETRLQGVSFVTILHVEDYSGNPGGGGEQRECASFLIWKK